MRPKGKCKEKDVWRINFYLFPAVFGAKCYNKRRNEKEQLLFCYDNGSVCYSYEFTEI